MAAGTSPVALRGIILRDEGSELVVQATPEEVRQFARGGRDVIVGRGRMTMTTQHATAQMNGQLPAFTRLRPGDTLYNEDGQVVALISDLALSLDHIDTTTFGSSNRTYMPGRRRVDIRAVGIE